MNHRYVHRPRPWLAAVIALAAALGGVAVALAPLGVRADEGTAPAVPPVDASGAAVTDAGAAADSHGRRGPIIIIRPGYPCYPIHPCPIPNPCYDPNFPPFPGPPVPPPGSTPGPTVPPGATPAPPTPFPMASPTPGGAASTLQYRVCPQVAGLIPQHIQDLATTEPWRYYGYGMLQNPNIPHHPLWNSYRTWLSLRDPGQPYSTCNLPQWKSGCY